MDSPPTRWNGDAPRKPAVTDSVRVADFSHIRIGIVSATLTRQRLNHGLGYIPPCCTFPLNVSLRPPEDEREQTQKDDRFRKCEAHMLYFRAFLRCTINAETPNRTARRRGHAICATAVPFQPTFSARTRARIAPPPYIAVPTSSAAMIICDLFILVLSITFLWN